MQTDGQTRSPRYAFISHALYKERINTFHVHLYQMDFGYKNKDMTTRSIGFHFH